MFLYKIYILQLTYAIFLNNNNIDPNSVEIELKENISNNKIKKYTIQEIMDSDILNSTFWRGLQFLDSHASGVLIKVKQTSSGLNADFNIVQLNTKSAEYTQYQYKCTVEEKISKQISLNVGQCINIFTDKGSTKLTWPNFKLSDTCNVLQLLNDIQFNACIEF